MLLKKLQIVRIKRDSLVFKRDQVTSSLCDKCPYYSKSLGCTFIGICRKIFIRYFSIWYSFSKTY